MTTPDRLPQITQCNVNVTGPSGKISYCTAAARSVAATRHTVPILRDLSPSVSQNFHAAGCCSVRATRVSRRRPTTADPAPFTTTVFQRGGNGNTPPWMRPRTTTLERESEKKNVVSELRFRYLKRMNDTRPFGRRRIDCYCHMLRAQR